MKAKELALIIHGTLRNVSAGAELVFHPMTGDGSSSEIIIGEASDTRLSMPCSRDPHSALIEAWINHHFLTAMATGEGQGFRDHTSGQGYGLNIHPSSRILVEVFKGGFRLTAIYVRPR